MAQVSRNGIARISSDCEPYLTCYPSSRSSPLPIMPVQTTPNPSPQGGGEFSFLSDKSETVAVGRAIPARRCAPNRWRQAPSRRSTYAVTAAFVAGIHLAACSGACGWLDPGHKARNDLWEAG